jgi:Zn-dependent protease with chaperone function
MPLLLLVFLALVCLPDLDSYEAPQWIDSPGLSGLLTLGVVGLLVLAAAWLAQRTITQLSLFPERRENILAGYDRARRWQNLALFVGYGLILSLCGWGWAVRQLWRWDGGLLPLPELPLLLPFFLPMILSWAFWFGADRAAHRALHPNLQPGEIPPIFAQRWTYVLFHLRAKLGMVLIPIGLLVFQKELRHWFGWTGPEAEDWVRWLGLITLVVVIPLMPFLVRLILGLERMPDGDLRRRLETVARRLRFRCTDLLVWNTRGGMANAMVLGLFPWPRYVVFTDRLLEEFRIEEIEAVFGHEIGHVKHQHMLYYMGFLMVSIVVVALTVSRVLPMLSDLGLTLAAEKEAGPGWGLFNREMLSLLPLVAVLVVYIFVVFGFLSRRCERQADIYGCRAVSCADPTCPGHDPEVLPPYPALCPSGIRIFIRALEKVAYVNGISKDRPGFLQSWQHSTIALRIEFLQSLLREPDLEPRFQRRVALVKLGLLVLLTTALVALLGTHGLAG